jgi:pimeloyl-ACP methyl ester carboxylesterase
LIGWHLAANEPSRVAGLVSLDGTLVPPPQRHAESEAYLATLQPSGYEALVAASLPALFTPATPQAVRDEVSGLVRRTPARAIATLLRDLGAGSPFAPGTYAGPVLAISARTSQAAAGTSKASLESQLRARFAQLDYRVLDGSHFLMLERPREVNDAIAGFLLGRGLLR